VFETTLVTWGVESWPSLDILVLDMLTTLKKHPNKHRSMVPVLKLCLFWLSLVGNRKRILDLQACTFGHCMEKLRIFEVLIIGVPKAKIMFRKRTFEARTKGIGTAAGLQLGVVALYPVTSMQK